MTTIQLTLNKDDLEALQRCCNFHFINDPDLVAIAEHILEQVKLKEQYINATIGEPNES